MRARPASYVVGTTDSTRGTAVCQRAVRATERKRRILPGAAQARERAITREGAPKRASENELVGTAWPSPKVPFRAMGGICWRATATARDGGAGGDGLPSSAVRTGVLTDILRGRGYGLGRSEMEANPGAIGTRARTS